MINATRSYSASLITQGEHRFYTLTLPSDILAKCCFVSTREEDPQKGFQRLLGRKRAEEIADYIDNGLGTIPTSIVLSAQEGARFEYNSKTKTVQFRRIPKAFLILDGQHRVYGFSLARSALRVPVVVYTGLSRRNETRIFIDINTKQRPVSNELLLDIKRLAEYETDSEQQLRALFDLFATEPVSPLLGLMSPTARKAGAISRVTFNAAVKPLLTTISPVAVEDAFLPLAAYTTVHERCLDEQGFRKTLVKPVYFKAAMKLFPLVAQRVKDRYGANYSVDNFLDIMEPMFSRLPSSRLKNPGRSVPSLHEAFVRALQTGFAL